MSGGAGSTRKIEPDTLWPIERTVSELALADSGFVGAFDLSEKDMIERKKKTVLLMADDDEDDCLLMNEAVREIFKSEHFFCLRDGQELIDYLLRRGIYTDPKKFPAPDLIFLDLNMPRKDGFQTLKEIKEHPKLKAIPILIFSTAKEQEQIEVCYKLGANSYLTKPMLFENLLKAVRCLGEYWFDIAKLPPSELLCAQSLCEDPTSAQCN